MQANKTMTLAPEIEDYKLKEGNKNDNYNDNICTDNTSLKENSHINPPGKDKKKKKKKRVVIEEKPQPDDFTHYSSEEAMNPDDILYSCKSCIECICFESNIPKKFDVEITKDEKLNFIYLFAHYNPPKLPFLEKLKINKLKNSNEKEIKCNNCNTKLGSIEEKDNIQIGKFFLDKLKNGKIINPKCLKKNKSKNLNFSHEEINKKIQLYKENILNTSKFIELLIMHKYETFPVIFNLLKNLRVKFGELKIMLDEKQLFND